MSRALCLRYVYPQTFIMISSKRLIMSKTTKEKRLKGGKVVMYYVYDKFTHKTCIMISSKRLIMSKNNQGEKY